MSELFQFIFSLDDRIGKSIVKIIFICFLVGAVNYLVHIFWISVWERINLKFAQNYFKTNSVPADVSNLLAELHKAKVSEWSIIYRRVRDLVQMKQNGGDIDNDALADILVGAQSRKASFSNYLLGILIILGLVGTLRGLITAIVEVQPLLQNIQDIDQFPAISDALRLTLSGMSTAFVTTLAGLLATLGLGFLGWFFYRQNSAFLTKFEGFVSVEIIPHFAQTFESSIESAVEQLTLCTNTLKFATEKNVSAIEQAVQQLTDTSWGGQLEQQYILANKFGTTANDLLGSLTKISEHQTLIKSTVESFERLTAEAMSRITKYQETLHHGLTDFIPNLKEESEGLKKAIESYQDSQAGFIDELSSTLQRQLQTITANQQEMVYALGQLVEQIQIREIFEEQNQIFEGIETQLSDNQNETVKTLTQLGESFQRNLGSILDTQKQTFANIESQLVEQGEQLVEGLTELTDELQIRAALDAQNQVLGRLETRLMRSQQDILDTLTLLAGDLQIRPALETQNQIFRGIENHLISHGDAIVEQNRLMQALITNLQQLSQASPAATTLQQGGNASSQIPSQVLNQISLKFDLLNQKIDTLNNTARQPGLYRWFSEIGRWFSPPR